MEPKPFVLVAALTMMLPLVSCTQDYTKYHVAYQKNLYDLENSFKVIYWPDRVRIIIPTNELFVHQTYKYKTSADYYLHRLKSIIEEQQKTQKTAVFINAYSNNIASDEVSKELTQNQAQVVAQHIWSLGIDREQVHFVGCGALHPVASDQTTNGNATNRRIEIDIVDFSVSEKYSRYLCM